MGINIGTIIYIALAYYLVAGLLLGLVLFPACWFFVRRLLPRIREHLVSLGDWAKHSGFDSRNAVPPAAA